MAALIALTGLLVALVIGWLSFSLLPTLLYPAVPGAEMDLETMEDAVRAELEIARLGYQAETRTAATQLLIGVTGLSAALLAWQQFLRTREREQEESSLGRRQGNLTLLGKAMDMIASQSSAVRIGGLFSLASLAQQSEEHRKACAEALTAFIKEGCPLPAERPERMEQVENTAAERARKVKLARRADADQGEHEPFPPPSVGGPDADVITAVTLLLSLTAQYEDTGPAKLTGVDMCLINLEGASLKGADLSGSLLTGARLVRVNAAGANFTGADLRSTELIDVDFTGTAIQDTDWGGSMWHKVKVDGTDHVRWTWPEDGCGEVRAASSRRVSSGLGTNGGASR